MPGSRHPNKRRRRLGLIALIGLALSAMVAGGCYYGPDHPRRMAQAEPPYQDNSTPGTRVIVYDGDDQPQMKLRVRSRRTRVYDASMIPVGQVRPGEDSLEQRSRDGKSTAIVTGDGGGGELPDTWRLKAHGPDRWIVADGQGSPIAELYRDDDRWTLNLSDDPLRQLYVDRHQNPPVVVTDGGDRLLTVPRQDWSDPKLLLLTLDTFSPLDRYTLALFGDQRL